MALKVDQTVSVAGRHQGDFLLDLPLLILVSGTLSR